MKRRCPVLPLLALLLIFVPAAAQVSDWKEIKKPPLPPFHPQLPVRVVLPNGMVLLLQEDHELPLIDGTMRIREGSRTEPASKVGLVSIYGEVWRTGGTVTKTGDQLDDFLEARAAKVETDGGVDSTSISFSALKADFEDVFGVFLELLRQPAFREEKIALAQNQLNTAIARRNDEIDEIAARESTQLAYGDQNPYARVAEYATVAAVTRDDLVNWHKTYAHPNNIIFGIVGDFDAKAMEARLRQAFASWPQGPQAEKPRIEFTKAKPGFYFVAKEDVNQAEIRMVDLGIERRNPDYFAATVLNEAFGGSFSSRLFTTLRTERGLAYAVGGGIGSAFDHPGITRLVIGTKSATTAEAIEGLQAEVDKLLTNPPDEAELARAKDSILNSFIFNFDSKEKVLREQMNYEFYGYPLDFLERYRAEVEKATVEDVARVARKYLHKDRLAVLVVGNPGEIGEQLQKFGPVAKLDITIPPPPAEKQAGKVPPKPKPRAKPRGSAAGEQRKSPKPE
ncbi:MAG TPA: pitrilysin family protein [Terriglobales bacterium]|nr:pitrilysin family protein [Terriglobales bacterium]